MCNPPGRAWNASGAVMGKHCIAIAALIVAALVFQWVGSYAKQLDVDRSPEKHLFYKADKTLADPSGHYVTPILFPFDLIVMLLLSGALALASAIWGPIAFGGSAMLYVIPPLAYLAFDLAEDGWLALLLTRCVPLDNVTGLVLQALTAGKMAAVVGSGLLVVVYGVVTLYRGMTA